MAVKIGSARIGENGRITGGRPGDQTGKEVSTQNWYRHSKGWRVLRCNIPEARAYIAQAMKNACANSDIGYNQNERNTLYSNVKSANFDTSKTTKKVNTDCSALVRVCVLYGLWKVGKEISIGDFYTANEASYLLKSGCFKELTGSKYTNSSSYLCAGDVLVTKTKGHTVIVLNDGSQAEDDAPAIKYELGERILRNGDEGDDVKQLQFYLIQLGYSCGSYGADGDFGDATEIALKRFQKDYKLEVDGEYGPLSHKALMDAIADTLPAEQKYVQIIGGNCYVRSAPEVKSGNILGTVHEGDKYEYAGETSENGWNKIKYKDTYGYVSGKYSKLM